jgi:hypothetical protein
MMKQQIASILLAGTALAVNAATCDYLVRPVPPNLVRDADTTYLEDFAAGNAAGGTGPKLSSVIALQEAGSFTPDSWTFEAILTVQTNASDNIPLVQTTLPGNGSAGVTCLRSGGVGLHVRLPAGMGGLTEVLESAATAAGSNGRSIPAGTPVYVAAGFDLASGRAAVIVRSLDGQLLDNRQESFHSVQVRAPAHAASLPAPSAVSLGGPGVTLRAVRLSSRFRDEVVLPQPGALPAQVGETMLDAGALDPARVQTRPVVRRLGHLGYGNFQEVTVTEISLPLEAGDPWLELKLPGLAVGIYSLNLYGTIAPQGRTALDRVWRPCPMEFEALDAAGRRVEQGRLLLKQGFAPRRMQAFHLHVNVPGDYTARFRLADRAQERVELLRITLLDQLEGLPDVAIKRAQNLEPGASTQLTELTEARQQRDDAIWAGLPPVNLHMQVSAPLKRFRELVESVAAKPMPTWLNAPYAEKTDQGWSPRKQHEAIPRSLAPLDMVELSSGRTLTHAQVVAGEPWPGDWPDDGTGIYMGTQAFARLPVAVVLAPRAELLGERVRFYMGLLGAADARGASLPARYAAEGDPEVGHDAAMALVRLAYDWPALEMSLHEIRLSTHNPDLEYETDWTGERNGKYFYAGWSGDNAMSFLRAYDQVFPYLQGNLAFAQAVSRFIPWVKTPDDVVRFLDRWLVFASVRDMRRGLIRASPVEDFAARVLGPHPLTAPLCDLTRQFDEIHPYAGTYQKLYATALSRSGVYHIGSFMVYGFDAAALTVQKAGMCRSMRDQGVLLPMDLSDIERYRKVKGASDFMLDLWPAGGFPFMVGDASGGPHTGPQAMHRLKVVAPAVGTAYRLTGDPRHAWLLANVLGDTNAAIHRVAEGVRNPILHAPSRVVPDWGAILESGVEETNLVRKTAATLRLGIAQGHSHSDYLDLNLFALGLPLAVDLACRSEGDHWSRPKAAAAGLHNHAIAHQTNDFHIAGAQDGEPWLQAFAPPLLRASYVDRAGTTTLARDTIVMAVGGTESRYVFDLQRLRGPGAHTWCFHGCESETLALNTAMTAQTNRWTDRLLPGSQLAGTAPDALQATWTMTRTARDIPHTFNGGGVIKTVACEPTVLGEAYDSNQPPVRVRATLLGRAGDTILQGNPYSQPYAYCFPFLWVRSEGAAESVYPAVYEWYRGDTATVANVELLSNAPLGVRVTTVSGQSDTYRASPSGLAVVSRDAAGIRYAQLNGVALLEEDGVRIVADRAAFVSVIESIDYHKRRIVLRDPLPADPGVSIGNAGHRTWLDLKGKAGREFTYEGDLLVHEAEVTKAELTTNGLMDVTGDIEMFAVGAGNRKAEGFTVCNEDLSWQFRDGRPILQPEGQALVPQVFRDADGDGRVHMKAYEIGVGDTAELAADVRVRRQGDGYEALCNVGATVRVAGRQATLEPSAVWQPLR